MKMIYDAMAICSCGNIRGKNQFFVIEYSIIASMINKKPTNNLIKRKMKDHKDACLYIALIHLSSPCSLFYFTLEKNKQ